MGVNSWEVSDEFWSRVKPLIPPKPERDPTKTFIRKPSGGRKPKPARVVFEATLSLVVTGANRHDVTQLEAVLDAIQVQRPNPPNDVANTSVQMQATGAQQPWRRLNAMVTFLTPEVAAKRLPTSNVIPKNGLTAG
jgi:hypothetical protein